jgi:hypothetical protein
MSEGSVVSMCVVDGRSRWWSREVPALALHFGEDSETRRNLREAISGRTGKEAIISQGSPKYTIGLIRRGENVEYRHDIIPVLRPSPPATTPRPRHNPARIPTAYRSRLPCAPAFRLPAFSFLAGEECEAMPLSTNLRPRFCHVSMSIQRRACVHMTRIDLT